MEYLGAINISMDKCCVDTYKKHVACKDNVILENITKLSRHDWSKERQFRITGSRYSYFYVCIIKVSLLFL